MNIFRIGLLTLALNVAACSSDEPQSTGVALPTETEAQDSQSVEDAVATDVVDPEQTTISAGEDIDSAAEPVNASNEIVLAQADTSKSKWSSANFREGTHYTVLMPAQPTSSSPEKIEVVEAFMYSCPHCYNFEPYVERWQNTIAPDVAFLRIPVSFNPMAKLHAQAYYTAELLGVLSEIHMPMFREIHVNKNFLNSRAALAAFFADHGVAEEDFNTAFDSFDVNTKLRRAEQLARRYRISSVPRVVVNGKYVSGAEMTGGYDSLLELVNEMVASER